MNTNNKTLVSFVIPSYNVENYIENCINSIIQQNYKNIEIIPVNDGSTDDTPAIIDRIASTDARIKPIHKKNEGVSVARNTGIDAVTGDFVVFVDGDDYLAPEYTDYMLSLVEDNNADFGLSVNCFYCASDKQIETDSVRILSSEDATALLLGPKVIVGCWNKIYRTNFLRSNNLRFMPELFYGEGLCFITKVSQLARRTVVGQKKYYYYRRNNYASACTSFNIKNFYNGSLSIDTIERDLIIRTPKVLGVLGWHRCQFKMGTVVRIMSANVVSEYNDYYEECLSYVRRHVWECLPLKGVSLYKKALLLGTAFCPALMAFLDTIRRKRIQKKSV